MVIKSGHKETEAGVIPRVWESAPLAQLSAFITKGSTPTTYGFKWEQTGVLFLRSECVSDEGLDLAQSMFISPTAHSVLRRSEVRDGDILITITGNVGRVVRLAGVGAANLNQHIARIRITASNADAQYIYQFLSQTSVRRHFNSITTGQAYPQISLQQVREAEVPLPPLPEQRAIAAALSDVDALIGALDKLIAKKRDLQQAAMWQLLTGKQRLPGFNGQWEVRQLGDVGVFRAGYGFPTRYQGGVEGEHPFFKVSDMNNDGNAMFMVNSNNWISETVRKAIGATLFPSHSIVFAKIGAAIFLERKKILPRASCIDNNMMGFIPDGTLVRDIFIHYLFLSVRLGKFVSTTALPSLNGNELAKLEFPFPFLDEQIAIASVLSDMDAEIAALEQRRDKTRDLKQGMMQELLTGKTRLI